MASGSSAGPATTPNGACIAREGGDDLAPDVLDGRERQIAGVAHDEAAHHVGLAVGPECGAGLARALDLG